MSSKHELTASTADYEREIDRAVRVWRRITPGAQNLFLQIMRETATAKIDAVLGGSDVDGLAAFRETLAMIGMRAVLMRSNAAPGAPAGTPRTN